jgi:hypothetical protein
MTKGTVLIGMGVLLALPLAGWTRGQAPPSSQPTGGAHGGKVIGYHALELSEEQQAEIREILREARAEADSQTDVQGRHEVWKAAVEQIKTTVLTQGQREELARLREGK